MKPNTNFVPHSSTTAGLGIGGKKSFIPVEGITKITSWPSRKAMTGRDLHSYSAAAVDAHLEHRSALGREYRNRAVGVVQYTLAH